MELEEADQAAIQNHAERHFGQPAAVIHELLSAYVHLDLLPLAQVAGGVRRVVTMGMSARPMQLPPGSSAPPYAELVLTLPEDWPMSQEAWQDSKHYWPIEWLKNLARLPHQFETWLGHGHTVPHGDPPEPVHPSTRLCGFLVADLPAQIVAGSNLELAGGRQVRFYSVIPLHRDEMDFKLRKGVGELLSKLRGANPLDAVDVGRPAVVVKKGFWPFVRFGPSP